MAVSRNGEQFPIKFNRIPEDLCYGNASAFVQQLAELLYTEIPIDFDNVIVGVTTPGEDDKNKIWFRLDRNNNFLGIFAFSNGQFRRVHNYRNDEIIWMHGVSSDIPEGFELITTDTGGILQTVKDSLISRYVETSTGSGVFNYFAVRYTGF